MLLDPAEQEFDLPAALIESCNLDCRAFEIIGDESDHSAFVTPDLMRRNGIGRLELPLLASDTLASAMIVKLSPLVLRRWRDFVLRKRVFTLTRVTKKALAALIFFHQPK